MNEFFRKSNWFCCVWKVKFLVGQKHDPWLRFSSCNWHNRCVLLMHTSFAYQAMIHNIFLCSITTKDWDQTCDKEWYKTLSHNMFHIVCAVVFYLVLLCPHHLHMQPWSACHVNIHCAATKVTDQTRLLFSVSAGIRKKTGFSVVLIVTNYLYNPYNTNPHSCMVSVFLDVLH